MYKCNLIVKSKEYGGHIVEKVWLSFSLHSSFSTHFTFKFKNLQYKLLVSLRATEPTIMPVIYLIRSIQLLCSCHLLKSIYQDYTIAMGGVFCGAGDKAKLFVFLICQ